MSVAVLGKTTQEQLNALAYHYPITALTNIPLTDNGEAEKPAAWERLTGTTAIDYALVRNRNGRVFWLAVRTGDRAVAVAYRIEPKTLDALLAGGVAGYDAELLCVDFSGGPPRLPAVVAPAGWVAVRGKREGTLPERWFDRRDLGILMTDGAVGAYADGKWLGESELAKMRLDEGGGDEDAPEADDD